MADAADLRAKAEQCRRIASETRNPRLSQLLQALAGEFIEAAEQIEASGEARRDRRRRQG
jgi:hypothetical protein